MPQIARDRVHYRSGTIWRFLFKWFPLLDDLTYYDLFLNSVSWEMNGWESKATINFLLTSLSHHKLLNQKCTLWMIESANNWKFACFFVSVIHGIEQCSSLIWFIHFSSFSAWNSSTLWLKLNEVSSYSAVVASRIPVQAARVCPGLFWFTFVPLWPPLYILSICLLPHCSVFSLRIHWLLVIFGTDLAEHSAFIWQLSD